MCVGGGGGGRGDVGRGGKRENIVTQIDTSKSLVTILLNKWEPPTEHVFYFTFVAAHQGSQNQCAYFCEHIPRQGQT